MKEEYLHRAFHSIYQRSEEYESMALRQKMNFLLYSPDPTPATRTKISESPVQTLMCRFPVRISELQYDFLVLSFYPFCDASLWTRIDAFIQTKQEA
jgi:hypothetical protein